MIGANELQYYRILVVDDSSDLSFVFAHILRRAGAEVVEAKSMREGLREVCSSTFDCILCDISMPHGDGVAFTRAIRAMEQDTGGRLPVAAVTGNSRMSEFHRAMAAGFDDYLLKPVDAKCLVRLVKHLLTQPKAGARLHVGLPRIGMIAHEVEAAPSH